MNMLRRGFLAMNQAGYERIARPLIFRASAQDAHARLMRALSWLDRSSLLCAGIHRLAFERQDVEVGGVTLPFPFILAAGLVKGHGFDTEAEAMAAVERGENIIPGWRAVPRLVGLVEFGSFTRYPRPGNPGVVVWRDERTASTQNRVGLKNPGAIAAAAFLSKHARHLPEQFGINIAASPGVTDPEQETAEIAEAFEAFVSRKVRPAWFTLNISCPNTEDDPGGYQTGDMARRLCSAAMSAIGAAAPLWVKVSPGLAVEQYQVLMRIFHETGAQAVVTTNTLAQPTPEQSETLAGVGGGRLHEKALEAARYCVQERARCGYQVDVIGCGGVMDGASYLDYRRLGIKAVQYWSALVYRGPLAAAIIEHEARQHAAFAGRQSVVGN